MFKKILSVCTLGSLLMAMLCAWCWMQSASKVGQFTFERDGKDALRFWSFEGNFIVSRSVMSEPQGEQAGHLSWASTPRLENGNAPAGLTLASGFSYQTHPLKEKNGVESILILPAWAVTAMFALLPAWWLARKIRPKSKKKPAAA